MLSNELSLKYMIDYDISALLAVFGFSCRFDYIAIYFFCKGVCMLLKQPPESPLQANNYKRILTISTSEGVFAFVWTIIAFEAILAAFYTRLGFTPFLMGLAGLIPYLSLLLQGLFAKRLTQVTQKRRFVVIFTLISRSIWFGITFVPFIPKTIVVSGIEIPYFQTGIFLILLVISWFIATSVGLVWASWMSDSVAASRRGKFFGIRNTILQAARICVLFVVGLFLGEEPSLTWEYPILFFIAAVAGILSSILVSRQPELQILPNRGNQKLSNQAFRAIILEAIQDKEYKFFLIFIVVWYFMNVLAGPFWIPFCIKYVNMTEQMVTQMLMVSTMTTMLFFYIWGIIIEKYGDRPVLILACVGSSITPFFYVIASAGLGGWTWQWMFIEEAISGIMNAGLSLAIFNFSISYGKPHHRNVYLVIYYVVAGFFGTVAAFSSGIIVEYIPDFILFQLPIYGMTLMMLFASLGRIICAVLATNLGSRGTTHQFLHSIWSVFSVKVWHRLFQR